MASISAVHIPLRPAWAEIDLGALARNAARVRAMFPPGVRIMAMVKAGAYGHGAVSCAQTLLANGCQALAVALIQEAAELRTAGVLAPILVLTPPLPEEIDAYLDLDTAFTLTEWATAAAFHARATATGRLARAHVKIDTGMGRVGVNPSEAVAFVREAAKLKGLRLEGLATHFSSSDDDLPLTARQWKQFELLCDAIRADGITIPCIHAANSGAVLRYPEAAGTCVRPGLVLYGYAPSPTERVDLEPVLSLRARVDFVKRVPAGTRISYGGRYEAPSESTIATVPIGYADGYRRALSGKASALVRGVRVPSVGTICMDQIMLDVGDLPVRDGDIVTLIGRDESETISAWDVALLAGTIPYEILTGISARVPRVSS
jgi:alanine racemase